jgi:energy-coupling factor transporter ATP-binding protein EcfA2
MIDKITVKNFRSIEEAEVALSRITVFYGPTSSGKSSLLYALMVLRNFVLEPGRQADGLFDLKFMNLGGFDACVFNHDLSKNVEISVGYRNRIAEASYGISFSKTSCDISQILGSFQMTGKVSVPYPLNQTFPFTYKQDEDDYSVNWNGITCSVAPTQPTAETQAKAQEIATHMNKSAEVIKAIDISPPTRGFFKPFYTPASPSLTPTTEDEVASVVINDVHLPGRIMIYAEEIFNRDFTIRTPSGTSTNYFMATDKRSRIPVYLVNEGFGVNQVIYLLAKVLRIDVRTILIEEPEVHLHPSVIRNFVKSLCSLAKEEEKQIVLVTHSEQFLFALLGLVVDGILTPDDIRCYLTTKERKNTTFEEQKVHENGQIEGGLKSFMEGEMEDIKKFLGVK